MNKAHLDMCVRECLSFFGYFLLPYDKARARIVVITPHYLKWDIRLEEGQRGIYIKVVTTFNFDSEYDEGEIGPSE